ncbi:FecR domain-containing protein [Enterovirga sp.]|uniref:FecR domain-containing protein n=1 Tax=Enterovirga sp. TaxID=2026350 RepID=UPI00260E8396|nr:FecR domain-containing protein [Enterovirga sp.]MDB5591084.1 hypothetical protein [Enterovirga sp.]
MPPRRLRIALAAATCLAGPPVLAQEIGTAGAVNPASTGTPPARPTRVLQIGSRVVFKERINTTAGGNVQLVFVDKTTMSIGPNSTVVIDEFVYDPGAGTGKLTASMAKGVLRLVGGNTSHSGGAEIKTPSATLGIRGGVATVQILPCTPGMAAADCGTKVTNHFGTLNITTAAGTEVIRRPGFVVHIPGGAAVPSAPRRATAAEVSQQNRSLTSKPGQTGGTRNRVTAAAIDQANVAGPLIAQIGASVAAIQGQTQAQQPGAATTLGLAVSPNAATTPTQIQIAAADTQQQAAAQVGQSAAAGGNAANLIGPGHEPGPPASPHAFALNLAPIAATSSPGGGPSYQSPVLGFTDGGEAGTSAGRSRFLAGGLTLSGSGSAQRSGIYVVAGQTQAGAGGPTGEAAFASSTRGSDGNLVRSWADLGGSGPAVTLDASGAPTSLDLRGTARLRSTSGAASDVPSQLAASRTETPAGLGASRPQLNTVVNPLFGGLFAGLASTFGSTSPAPVNTAVTGLFDISLNPTTSQFGTTLGVQTSSNSEGDALRSGTYFDFGRAVESFFVRPDSADGRGTYVDDRNFGAVDARGLDGRATTEVNGARVETHRGGFVTADTVNARSFFPGVNFCQCEFTRWGFWSSETTRTNASGQALTDLVHLGTWVYGDPTRFADMPSTGTATYVGHAVASIRNGSSEYLAASNFTNTVDFGNRTGVVSIPGLDGRSYAGTVTAGGGNFIGGTIASSVPGSSMALNGQFFRGASGPAGEMGGTLSIGGTPGYAGAGIFNAAAAAPR